ncbi:hypothetical protein EJA72_09710 [Pseudomonas sp. PB120]|uniref:hypothetical protein n=1 Tax=Pseudomonas sp. PB120 TaxID=2494700 RepID=UPI0012FDBEA6|nr:hypothetical protein [Pseudomonas sp. PB120]MVV48515.1 hypothetical protein [Pseudomonas sp. PB120]
MPEQYKVITTGELNASIEGFGEFTTKEVEFIGSDDDPDFLLQGANSERGFVLYVPKYESEKYSLHPGSLAKAFYEVGGRLYGEVEEGVIKVTVNKPETVIIAFEILVKESASETRIKITGSGTFKGRSPWASKHRGFLTIARGNAPLWFEGPDIIKPKPGVVSPGFQIVGRTGIANPDDWELKILIGSTVILQNKGQSGREFSYDVPANLIPAGTGFYFMLDYYIWPAWSKWTYSGDLVMGMAAPDIIFPKNDSSLSPRSKISGRGTPGATVRLYEAGSGAILYGSATVGVDGNWECVPDVALPTKYFPLTADQVLNSLASGYSTPVYCYVSPLSKPVIELPQQGGTVGSPPAISGRGGLPGASIQLHQHGDGQTVYSRADVNDQGRWVMRSWATVPPKGSFLMTARQVNGVDVSDWADGVDVVIV